MKTWMLAAALALGLGATAYAEPGGARHEDAHAVSVQHAQLDLAQREDAALLLSRVRLAAARACDVPYVSRPDARLRQAIAECRADAVANTVERLNQPELTRVYLASAR